MTRYLSILLVLLSVPAKADFFAVGKVVSINGSPAYEVRSWPSAQAFVSNTNGVSYGTRPQSVGMELFTTSPNGDLYTVQVDAGNASNYEVYRYRDAYDFANNNNTIIGVCKNAGILAGVTYDASGQFYAVKDTTIGSGSRTYTVKRWPTIYDFIYDTNPTTLGIRTNSGVQTGIEFIDGKLYSIEDKTTGGVPKYEVWDWGTSFTGFINKTGTLVGTRTGIGETVAIFSQSHAAPQAQSTVARNPLWPWLGNKFPTSTPGSQTGWATADAFPSLTFQDPVKMIPQPNSNRLWVIGRQGFVWWFENNAGTTTKTLALDHYNSTMGWEDCGMLGLAFHPQFGQSGSPNRGYIYIWYNYRPTGNTGSVGANYNRLSRFKLEEGATTINPASEYVMINQFDEHSWHNGGDMFFGPDGFLYVTTGDEGGANDQYNNTQKMNGGLFSGVLRIDVDQNPAKSHPIRRQPQVGGTPPVGWPATYSQGYYIPNDNPWLDPNGSILEEFYAIGLRSPHRMTRDPVTGSVFIGDIGQTACEEVDVLAKGANYQWGYREGDIAGPKAQPSPLIGTDTPPVWSYARNQGDSCVIGGHVYRGGSLAADLGGKYIFGDFISGRIWSMTWQGASPVQVTQLTSVTGSTLSSFGVDHANELYLMSLGLEGKILKLVPANTQQPPATLSATGAFSNLTTLTPAAGVLPFNVNSPLWSDNAVKQRWIALPNNGAPYDSTETVAFNATSEWTYPAGTVLIKHFDLPIDDTNPAIRKRIETRFMVKAASGEWYGLLYKWRADGSDADLLDDSATQDIAIATVGGGTRVQQWYFPSRNDCTTCHTPASTQVLGLRTWQLNGTYAYPGTSTTGNQLQVWSDLGMFNQMLTTTQIAGLLKSVSISDTTAPLETRVRSYLDSNCAQCHRPGGVQAAMDFRFSTALAQQSIINGPLNNTLGIAGAYEVAPGSLWQSMMHIRVGSLDPSIQMPPLGKNVVDSEALAVIDQWINSLSPLAAPYPLTATPMADGTIELTWTSQSAIQSSLSLQRSTDGVTWTQITTPRSAKPGFTDRTVVANTTYHYRIAAWNKFGISPWSNIATATAWPAQGSWADWQRLHPLAGQNAPLQNPDGDSASNLLEAALAGDPASGGSAQDHFYLTSNTGGGLDAIVIRPANLNGITTTLLVSSALTNPMSWTPATVSPTIINNTDGTQTLTYPNLNTIPALATAKQGYVCLSVSLTATGETAHTATWFWDAHTFATGTRSFGPAMLKPERFSGTVTSGSTALDVTNSAGGTSVRNRFDTTRPAFIEITTGALAGHRFDINIAACTANTLALISNSPRNTLSPIPDLTGAAFIARDHWTLGEMFPAAQWKSSNVTGNADRIQFYDPATSGWITCWLATISGTPRWVMQGDSNLADQSALIIAPGTGLFIRKVSALVEIPLVGVLRGNAFALPAPAGTSLIASGWPADQSPAARSMLISNGFTGSNNSANADQFLRWSPDINPASPEGYLSHYLLKSGALQYWTPVGNSALPDESNALLFPRHQATFLRLKAAQSAWKMALPWNP